MGFSESRSNWGASEVQEPSTKDANDSGLTLVRPIPGRTPKPEEIDVDQLDRVFKRDPGTRAGTGATLWRLKVSLKKVATLYEPAVMLEFETTDSSRERQVAFAVEGQVFQRTTNCVLLGQGGRRYSPTS